MSNQAYICYTQSVKDMRLNGPYVPTSYRMRVYNIQAAERMRGELLLDEHVTHSVVVRGGREVPARYKHIEAD